jgi:hypothetical protein
VARHRAGQCGVHIPSEARDLYIFRNVHTYPAAHPVGTFGSFLGIKRLGREADHSAPSAEVKEWVELYLVALVCIISMYRDGFTFCNLLLCADLVLGTDVAFCAHSVEYCNAYFQAQKIISVSVNGGSIDCTNHVG